MRDIDFDEVTFTVPDETANDSSSVDDGSAQGVHDGALDAGLIGFGDFDGNGDDPLSQLRKNPTVRNLVTVTFTRSEFMEHLASADCLIQQAHTVCSMRKWMWTASAH